MMVMSDIDGRFSFYEDSKLQYLYPHFNVPFIVKRDTKSLGLHFGWHLQIKLIFNTQSKEQDDRIRDVYIMQNRQQNNKAKADCWSKTC